MEYVFVLSLVIVFTLTLLLTIAGLSIVAGVVATLKGSVVMSGCVVTFPTGNKRWVQNPQRYVQEGYPVVAETVCINITDLKESVHGVYVSDAWDNTDKEPTSDMVVQFMVLGNKARKEGFIKTLFAM